MLKPVSQSNRLSTWESQETPLTREETLSPSVLQRGEVPTSLKSTYLARVENSHTFARSVQLRRLLAYLGQRAIDDTRTPTETEVAMAVLHRNEQFDPQSDSLVRKEMSRLRAKLAAYYAGEGNRDVVLIQSNRSYRFEFRWRSAAAEVPADPRPCLLILPPAPSGGAEALFDELMLCLGGSTRYRLISRTSAHWYAGLSNDVRQICSQSGADLLVEIVLRGEDGAHSVLLWIVDGHNGNSLASTRIAVPAGDWQQAAALAAKWLNEYERSEEKR